MPEKVGTIRPDLLVINKIDLDHMVGASLQVIEEDTRRMRKELPFVFTNMKSGQGIQDVISFIEQQGMLTR